MNSAQEEAFKRDMWKRFPGEYVLVSEAWEVLAHGPDKEQLLAKYNADNPSMGGFQVVIWPEGAPVPLRFSSRPRK